MIDILVKAVGLIAGIGYLLIIAALLWAIHIPKE